MDGETEEEEEEEGFKTKRNGTLKSYEVTLRITGHLRRHAVFHERVKTFRRVHGSLNTKEITVFESPGTNTTTRRHMQDDMNSRDAYMQYICYREGYS
jgi:hypothetical protein